MTQNQSDCVLKNLMIFDAIAAQLAGCCCNMPAIVLGHVLFTSSPGPLQGTLPNAPVYTILLDGYPFRRLILPGALETFISANLLCQMQSQPTRQGPTVVAAGIVGVALNGGEGKANFPNPPPYLTSPAPIGNLKAYGYNPGTTGNLPGRILVTFDQYQKPPNNNNTTFNIKAMVVEPVSLAPTPANKGNHMYPPLPSFTLAFDSFGDAGIYLTLVTNDCATAPSTMMTDGCPEIVSWEAIFFNLFNFNSTLYVEIEVTRYPS
jgi:hypothetical protein